MPIYVLGISAFYHDSAAAILCDGEVVAAAQEERFTRKKHDASFPRNAIEYCLRESGIKEEALGCIAFYENPYLKFDRLLKTYLAFSPAGFESLRQSMPLWAGHHLNIPRLILQELPRYQGVVLCFDHHESHGASAFFPSPFEEAALLTLDAVGEWSTSSIGYGKGNRIELKHAQRFPHSLGMLYSAFTYYTGFKVNSGEYKLMGLAPYGTPRYVDHILTNLVDLKEDGSIWLDMSYFNYCQGLTMTSEKFHQLFGGPPRRPETMITEREMDLAASIQKVCEEAVLRSARWVKKETGSKNLVMAGGVALNCVANGRIRREGPFDQIWVQPAAGDAGGALGAALLAWHHELGRDRFVKSPDSQQGSFLGPSFDDLEIGLYLEFQGARFDRIDNEDALLDRVARLIDQGMVVGWFHGRMEYGPRALGARSIIGDARNTEMQQKMNLKIKFRESFRPFAPCVLREFADSVFEMESDEDSPYMLFVAPVRTDWRVELSDEEKQHMRSPDLRVRVSVPRSRVPAITHVDYSARIQTVDAVRHGRFYRLMRRFYELTGCPVIVNTSFNIRGEPIVCSPADAFECFMGTDMDCLVLENYLLMKEDQPVELRRDPEVYQARYELD